MAFCSKMCVLVPFGLNSLNHFVCFKRITPEGFLERGIVSLLNLILAIIFSTLWFGFILMPLFIKIVHWIGSQLVELSDRKLAS